MKKTTLALLLCLTLLQVSGQEKYNREVSIYLSGQYVNTLRDITRGNNPWGFGPGLQAFLNTSGKFKPTIEITGHVYPEDDKVLRMRNGEALEDIRGVISVFTGTSFHPHRQFFTSLLVGPAWISSKAFPGIKPSLGFYLSKNNRWVTRLSYIHVFNREEMSKQDFTSISFSLGYRLY